jgi:predicted lipoprotein with Yx(FWY)xxD motif
MNTTGRTTQRIAAWIARRATRVSALVGALAIVTAGAAFAATTTTIRTTANPNLGRILVGPARYTLYVWCKGGSQTNCPGSSSSSWPALIAHGKVVAASGSQLTASKLSTRKLSNGQHQVTYYGHPLYLYKGDKKPGRANGEGKYGGSGAWFAINKYGQAVPSGGY